ncbi:MAG: S26 family signal peptidase [Bacteroidales bacterium]|nr:S26 family signal peptidase [Bacteroidales bacterium]MDD2425567.1 S26 family signal peptidase [Bacteroidales bacterium]MDD3989423.1 S26 family signal peptidase [Bacteroidales bacterium]MDD4638261.1 S26 family signal peptidase [Bacteroidales bacterium]
MGSSNRHQTKLVENEQALAIIEEILKEGNSVKIAVRGNSMAPALIDGKDSVTLEPVAMQKRDLSVGDVILFRYKGTFLMHRIVAINSRGKASGAEKIMITTKGDALATSETISSEDVLAVARFKRHNRIELLLRRIEMSRYVRFLQNVLKK